MSGARECPHGVPTDTCPTCTPAPVAKPTFTKEDLIYLATDVSSTIGIRRSAAEALYAMGQRDGARELSAARNGDVEQGRKP